METIKVLPDELKGKTVEDMAITKSAVVIKFTDGTFFDIYLDKTAQSLKTSANKLDE
ncbi:hypothetical protein JCM9140_1552 [Halalkalibacter wakoensis JCM 9140]|uniref:Uncharacterized protein n=1 Tax=Halalkalibacter wakoensis JCM 9140 TaxID=1236970 RepID=W4Q0P8_9BACI|nr:hypothetical protein [Halalkalibacter wakoensis]GAE25552.1 hypothetical protein JCM9140_1552 [Halalkalibacter wakoensis JCM 9140]